MKRSYSLGYFLLGFSLVVLISIPPKKVHKLRASLITKALKLKRYSSRNEDAITKLNSRILYLKEQNLTLKKALEEKHSFLGQISDKNVARVIFRDPAFWSSSVLINKGIKDDLDFLEKNSPVISKGFLIGVVEEVFDTFSKVRLITDKNLSVSVKKSQDDPKSEKLEIGTLCGISSIDNRYKFKKVEGHFFAPNLKIGDQLVTSGLDGVFPEGLPVACVTSVIIEEEEVIYPFQANILASDIKDLKTVTILKPVISH